MRKFEGGKYKIMRKESKIMIRMSEKDRNHIINYLSAKLQYTEACI